MSDEKTHLAAAVAAINAVSGRAYTLGDLNDLPALPTSYNEVISAQKLTEAPRRAGAASTTTQWRVLTRAVAQDYGNAQEMRRRAALGLEDKPLSVGGEATTPVERALSDDPIAEDEGWFSGISEWSYAL